MSVAAGVSVFRSAVRCAGGRAALLLLVLLQAFALLGQEPGGSGPAPFMVAASLHTGHIIPHSRELVDVSGSRPFGVELDALWLLADERHTRASGLVSRRGAALHLIDFGAPELLGRMVSLTPFVEPMIRAQLRLHGSVRLGVGVAYLSRPYDERSNPRNLFYSTAVSFTAMVNAYLHYRLTPRLALTAGYNFNHVSNGGMKEPNKGINFPTWSVGAIHAFKPVHIQRPVRDDAWRTQARGYRYVLLSATNKNAPPRPGTDGVVRCYNLGGLGIWGRRIGRLSGLSVGTEWSHDGHARELMSREGVDESAWEGTLLGGPELISGRVRFALLFGAYVFAPSWEGDRVHQRYQLTYIIGRGVLVGASLKAHRHVADVFDLRLGWIW